MDSICGRDHKGRAFSYIFCYKAKGCRLNPSRLASSEWSEKKAIKQYRICKI